MTLFTKESTRIANNPMKRCLIAVAIREIQINSQWDTITHLPKWLKKKKGEGKEEAPSADKDVETLDHSHIAGGAIKYNS